MQDISMGTIETKFADIIWNHAPLPSSRLVSLAQEALGWKKSTTYTVLKRLCQKGIFQNNDGVVSVVLTRDDFFSLQSQRFIDETFHGSLPAFLAAFTSNKSLSEREVNQLRMLVQSYEEEK